jgi:hypothetical protein
MGRLVTFGAVLILLVSSCASPVADEKDLVEVYVLAIRAREDGKTEQEVQAAVDAWLEQRGVTREDLARLTEQLDHRQDAWARVWTQIDERLRAAPEN